MRSKIIQHYSLIWIHEREKNVGLVDLEISPSIFFFTISTHFEVWHFYFQKIFLLRCFPFFWVFITLDKYFFHKIFPQNQIMPTRNIVGTYYQTFLKTFSNKISKILMSLLTYVHLREKSHFQSKINLCKPTHRLVASPLQPTFYMIRLRIFFFNGLEDGFFHLHFMIEIEGKSLNTV